MRPSSSTASTRIALLAVLGGVAFLVSYAHALADEAPDMSGAELYRVFCASCHGKQGRGDGPVAATLKTKVPDLTRIAARHGGTYPAEQVRAAIDGQDVPRAHGSRAMPVWGWDFYAVTGEDPARRKRADELIARLVDHLATIQAP